MYSSYVKNCMADALLELSESRRYEAITITDLCDRAQVSRVSFYRHFDSKDDILLFRFTSRYEAWMRAHPEYDSESEDSLIQAEGFFEFMLSERGFLEALVRLDKMSVLLDFLHNLIGPNVGDDAGERFYRSFYIHGCFGIYCEWVEMGMVQSPGEMSRFIHQGLVDRHPIPVKDPHKPKKAG